MLLDSPCSDAVWSKEEPLPHLRSSRNSTVSRNHPRLCCFSVTLATKGKALSCRQKIICCCHLQICLAREIVVSVNFNEK